MAVFNGLQSYANYQHAKHLNPGRRMHPHYALFTLIESTDAANIIKLMFSITFT